VIFDDGFRMPDAVRLPGGERAFFSGKTFRLKRHMIGIHRLFDLFIAKAEADLKPWPDFRTRPKLLHGDHERPLPGAQGVAEVSSRCARSRQTWDGAVSDDGRRARPVTRLARAVFRV